MKEKKQRSNWYVASVHYATAGIFWPWIIGILISFGFMAMGMEVVVNLAFEQYPLIAALISTAIFAGVTYVAVIASARFIQKRYIVEDMDAVLKISLIYFVGVTAFFISTSFWFPDPEYPMTAINWVATVIDSLVLFGVFYWASKKYLR
ncbi:hypothetical protein COB18_03945 [Candidatus Kaiserbacteria bacterium]|nr:MAG: hypothetical protein COB18_03945 [Candidatus Kaiserbacteria bacterium]